MHTTSPPPALPRRFNRLAWSNLAAQSAEQVGLAAAPIVAVLVFGAGAGATGLLQTAQTLPYLLFAIPAGVLADRMSRRKLMAGAEALRAVSLAAMLVAMQAGLLSMTLLAMLGFAGACGTVAYSVAAPALVPSLVPRELLAAANARIELARTVAFAGGPALAGALVGWTGAGAAFAFATALSVCAVFMLAGLAEPARAVPLQRNVAREVREGAAFVFGHALLMPVFATQVVFNTAFFMMQAMYVPYAINTLGLSAGAVGATLSGARRGHGRRRPARAAHHARGAFRGAGGDRTGCRRLLGAGHARNVAVSFRAFGGLQLLPARRRAGAVGHLHRDLAPVGHAAAAARTRFGHVYIGARIAPNRGAHWRPDWGRLWR